jgi:hypothetical protein
MIAFGRDYSNGEFTMVQASGPALWSFLVIVVVCWGIGAGSVAAISAPAKRVRNGVLAFIGLVVWTLVQSIPVYLGWVTPDHAIPGAPLLMGVMFLVVLAVVVLPVGRRLSHTLPLWLLVGAQGLRLPIELVLHAWAEQGVAPPQMTWTGQNLDIIAGVVCLMAAPFAARSRAVAWASQGVGVVLMANVLRVVFLSLPTPFRQFDEPLLIAFQLPAQWIATVCVAGAILFHGLTIRKLLTAK